MSPTCAIWALPGKQGLRDCLVHASDSVSSIYKLYKSNFDKKKKKTKNQEADLL